MRKTLLKDLVSDSSLVCTCYPLNRFYTRSSSDRKILVVNDQTASTEFI